MTAEDVQELFDGLEINGLTDDYTHVLTGMYFDDNNTLKVRYLNIWCRLYWKLRHFRKNRKNGSKIES